MVHILIWYIEYHPPSLLRVVSGTIFRFFIEALARASAPSSQTHIRKMVEFERYRYASSCEAKKTARTG